MSEVTSVLGFFMRVLRLEYILWLLLPVQGPTHCCFQIVFSAWPVVFVHNMPVSCFVKFIASIRFSRYAPFFKCYSLAISMGAFGTLRSTGTAGLLLYKAKKHDWGQCCKFLQGLP